MLNTLTWIRFGLIITLILLIAGCGSAEQVSNSHSDGTGSNTPNNENPQASIDLTVSSYLPAQHGQHDLVLQPFLDEVAQVTEGRVTGTLYPGDALGPAETAFDMAVTGTVDMALGNHGYTPGSFPLSSILNLPGFGSSSKHVAEIFWDLLAEYEEIQQEYKDVKIGWFPIIDPYYIMTSKQKVKTLEDVQGLRVRTPSEQGSRLLELIGAVPVQMSMNDVYEGLMRGTIDGALVPASTIINFQLADVVKYITVGDFMTQSLFVVMNKNTWDKISPEDQKAIDALLGREMWIKAAEVYDQEGIEGLEMAKEKGVEIIELSEAERNKLRETLKPMVDEWIEDVEGLGYPGQEIYDRAMELREKYSEE